MRFYDYMMNNNKKLTRHHIVPRSKGGWMHKDNIKLLKAVQHRALHTLFANQTPVEQLRTLVLDVNTTTLTSWFKNDIMYILEYEDDNEYYYKDWIFRNSLNS